MSKGPDIVGRVYQSRDIRMAVNDAPEGDVELVFSSPAGVSRTWLVKDFVVALYRELAARVEGASISDNVVPLRRPPAT